MIAKILIMFTATVVDASGKAGSGIYGGNTLWYGSYSECQKLPNSRYCWTMFPGNIFLSKNDSQVRTPDSTVEKF